MSILTFAVCGTSKSKIRGVELGLERLGIRERAAVIPTHSKSIGNEQPFGYRQGFSGAMGRVATAIEHQPGNSKTYFVGIEHFLFSEDEPEIDDNIYADNFADRGCIYIHQGGLFTSTPKVFTLWTNKCPFPSDYVWEAFTRGFKTTTAGQVMFEAGVVKDKTNPHKDLSGKNREEYIAEAIANSLYGVEF